MVASKNIYAKVKRFKNRSADSLGEGQKKENQRQ